MTLYAEFPKLLLKNALLNTSFRKINPFITSLSFIYNGEKIPFKYIIFTFDKSTIPFIDLYFKDRKLGKISETFLLFILNQYESNSEVVEFFITKYLMNRKFDKRFSNEKFKQYYLINSSILNTFLDKLKLLKYEDILFYYNNIPISITLKSKYILLKIYNNNPYIKYSNNLEMLTHKCNHSKVDSILLNKNGKKLGSNY